MLKNTYNTTSLSFTLVDKWIKNVYSLRITTGTTSDNLPTPIHLTQQFTYPSVYNSQVTPLFVRVFTSLFSTLENTYFNLLYSHLYPQSTAPINKKKREKMERNT